MQPQTATPKSVDIVLYLASLVTDFKAVDPWMDVVREITARNTPNTPLSNDEEIALKQLRAQLENYLITQDPVRAFTRETLAQRLQDHFKPSGEHDRKTDLRRALLRIWGATATAYMLPIIFLWNLPLKTRLVLGFALGFTITMYSGIMWFYLSALKDVKTEFKKAFIYICIGIAFTAASTVQFLGLNILGGWDKPLFSYGGFLGFFIISCFLILIGVGKIARLVGLSARLSDLKIVLPLTAVFATALVLLPHPAKVQYELFFDISLVSMGLCIYYMVASAIMVQRIRRVVNFSSYSKAFLWFMTMNIMVAVGCASFATVLCFMGEVRGFMQMITSSPFIISSLCMLQSGYTFKRDSK